MAQPRGNTDCLIRGDTLRNHRKLPELGVRFAEQGLQTAQRYAWPSVAERVLEIYELARERFTVSSRHEYE